MIFHLLFIISIYNFGDVRISNNLIGSLSLANGTFGLHSVNSR